MGNDLNIKDDEIRVIGSNVPDNGNPQKTSGKGYGKVGLWIAVAAIVLAVVAVILFARHKGQKPDDDQGLLEQEDSTSIAVIPDTVPLEKFGDYSDTTGKSYTEVISKTINDVPMNIYIPHNATPELCLGFPSKQDKSIILTTLAADIRRDNKKIVGAFVLKGEPLAWGLSKKGFCGIIDGKITVGVAENSPLFEQATETGGYFFRQYPLVDNGKLVENEPKNKSYRRALCERAGEIFIVKSESRESFHDFAQALVDLGCSNAIYLVGGDSYGFYRDSEDNLKELHKRVEPEYKYVNFILWKTK